MWHSIFFSVVSHSFAIENEHNFLCAFFLIALFSAFAQFLSIRLFFFSVVCVFGCCSFTVTQQHSVRGINESQIRSYLRLLAAWLCAIKTVQRSQKNRKKANVYSLLACKLHLYCGSTLTLRNTWHYICIYRFIQFISIVAHSKLPKKIYAHRTHISALVY